MDGMPNVMFRGSIDYWLYESLDKYVFSNGGLMMSENREYIISNIGVHLSFSLYAVLSSFNQI